MSWMAKLYETYERRGPESPLRDFFRFSFGPLKPESFDSDIAILKRTLIG